MLATFSDRAAVFSADDGTLVSSVAGSFDGGAVSANGAFAAAPLAGGAVEVMDIAAGTRVLLQTGTGTRLTSVAFGPTAATIVARDARGDVHVVRCEICDFGRRAAGARTFPAGGARADRGEAPPVSATG